MDVLLPAIEKKLRPLCLPPSVPSHLHHQLHPASYFPFPSVLSPIPSGCIICNNSPGQDREENRGRFPEKSKSLKVSLAMLNMNGAQSLGQQGRSFNNARIKTLINVNAGHLAYFWLFWKSDSEVKKIWRRRSLQSSSPGCPSSCSAAQ